MFDQLFNAFQPLFLSHTSGFLRGHSCCIALVKMVDDWRPALDSKKVSGSIAIDLSKAFDSICHNLLLAKLRAYGAGEEAIKDVRAQNVPTYRFFFNLQRRKVMIYFCQKGKKKWGVTVLVFEIMRCTFRRLRYFKTIFTYNCQQ